MLLNNPLMHHDESVEGYLMRSEILNYGRPDFLDITKLKSNASDEEIEAYILQLSLFTGENILRDNLIHDSYVNYFTLPGWKRYGFSRFCPECVKRAKYHRRNWSLFFYTTCSDHHLLLVQKCNKCNKKINVHDIVNGQCTKCYLLLEHSSTKSMNDFNRTTEELWESSFLSEYLTISEYYTIIKKLSSHLAFNIMGLSLSKHEEYVFRYWGYHENILLQWELNQCAMYLIEKWPSRIIYFLYVIRKLNNWDVFQNLLTFISKIENVRLREMLRKPLYWNYGWLGTDQIVLQKLIEENANDNKLYEFESRINKEI
ncbi:TniQ family protein [Paenibacillus chitinolyticus]